ncbi:isoprenylcysteine carboxylmethyltransferase family protein [Oceanicola sp. S124]|uniref:isoprenylcysteine carboxylmethyltransferase family protein n=1 Tax=Oceanicola sp. S124 TaxID=1042378 RepID=UPI00025585D9|nr:isoprenylcysteine carboxylmethyltransferase family protein [Oceanicola sp. S124]
MIVLISFMFLSAALRITSLVVSMRNERRLREAGAAEHHAVTTTLLALAHVTYYVSGFAEGLWRLAPADGITLLGLALYAASMLALFWVIRELGRLWTVKLMLARDHELVTSTLFARMRHPNYYLNILPELIGFALVMHAWYTLIIGLPLYAMVLRRRIEQEERIMRANFAGY